MKKLLILLALLITLPTAAFAQSPADQLNQFRQAENQAQTEYFSVLTDINTFININREHYVNFSPITEKFYGKKLISEQQKALAKIKKLPYSPAIKDARDAAVDKAEKNLALIKKAMQLIKRNLPHKEIIDVLEEERIAASIAEQKYIDAVTKITGANYSPLPRTKKTLHPSAFRSTTTDDGSKLLTGLITNNTDQDVHNISITFTLYNAEGRKSGAASDTVSIIPKDQSWQFAVKTTTPDFKYAKMEKIQYK